MELQFENKTCRYLRRNVWESKDQEQTLEVKLPEGMPDVGQVLTAWGQPVMRSKEWQDSTVQFAGGMMIWVLYVPEDGSEEQCIHGWIPFQMRWEFPQTQRDGTICVVPLLKSVDARSIHRY